MSAIINKSLLRLAGAIHSQLAHCTQDRPIQLPVELWQRCIELARQIQRAELRGWHLASDQLRKELGYTIPGVQTELTTIVSQLPRITTTEAIATTGELYGDLLALEQEFDEVDYDLHGRWLSITTEPIELQGIYLGPFEIRLDWGRASNANEPGYRVIAKEPHPAGSDDNVTHPHVMGEHLCEGNSRVAMRHALSQGRLLDFFTLVANGLRSYNPESPFVALEIWYGQTCSDCGAVVDDEDRYVCQKCEETICDRCESTCCGCDDSCCSQCIRGCEVCDDNYCRGCLRACKQCRASVCSSCLEDDERCFNCHEKERQERTEKNGPATVSAAVQPHGLGQALVPA